MDQGSISEDGEMQTGLRCNLNIKVRRFTGGLNSLAGGERYQG